MYDNEKGQCVQTLHSMEESHTGRMRAKSCTASMNNMESKDQCVQEKTHPALKTDKCWNFFVLKADTSTKARHRRHTLRNSGNT
jgi:hypothetical protein